MTLPTFQELSYLLTADLAWGTKPFSANMLAELDSQDKPIRKIN
jgi:hypothetical protein